MRQAWRALSIKSRMLSDQLMKYLFTTATVIKWQKRQAGNGGVSPMNDPKEAVRSIRLPTAFCVYFFQKARQLSWGLLDQLKKGVAKNVHTTALARVTARQQAKRLWHCSTKLSYADESTAGLEPVTHGLPSEVCLFYGTCLFCSEATGGEGSELHQ